MQTPGQLKNQQRNEVLRAQRQERCMNVLDAISETEVRTVRQLAPMTGIDQTTLSAMLRELHERGLVERRLILLPSGRSVYGWQRP